MRTFDKGTITELEVQLALVKKGLQVFTPINEGCRVDLVFIDSGGICRKVQVKKASTTALGFALELRYSINKRRTEKGLYTNKDIDFFATIFNEKLYLIPISDVKEMRSVVLRFDSIYKNQNRAFFARDYEI